LGRRGTLNLVDLPHHPTIHHEGNAFPFGIWIRRDVPSGDSGKLVAIPELRDKRL